MVRICRKNKDGDRNVWGVCNVKTAVTLATLQFLKPTITRCLRVFAFFNAAALIPLLHGHPSNVLLRPQVQMQALEVIQCGGFFSSLLRLHPKVSNLTTHPNSRVVFLP